MSVAGLVLVSVTLPSSGKPPPSGFPEFGHQIVGPPPGHTGGFGEPTCLECHIGSRLNQPGSTLAVIGIGGSYRPGETYEVTVRLLSYDMLAAGFQAAFRKAEDLDRGKSAGVLRSLDDRVAVVPSESGDVRYVQHTDRGTPADGELAEWTFEWTAPEHREPVALHVAANSGNGDNSPLDDLVYTSSIILTARRER